MAGLVVAQVSPGQTPACFGKPATITGGGTIAGTAGNDVIVGSAGADQINGLEGDDSVCGLDGNDTLTGGAGADRLDGGLASDTLKGGDGADMLLGVAGNDQLSGGPGADVMAGGVGIDTVSLSEQPTGPFFEAPIAADLDNVADDGHCAQNLSEGLCPSGSSEGDNVRADVENMVGGNGFDTLTGSAAANWLHGGGVGSGDTLSGLGGPDLLEGGGGLDTLSGGDGADILRGDDVFGDRSSDTLLGGGGDDQLDGGQGDAGDPETHEAEGDLAPDALKGGPGIDTVTYAPRRLAIEVTLDGVANDGLVTSPASDSEYFLLNCDDPSSLDKEDLERCEEIRQGLSSTEEDNVNRDVENVLGGLGDDVITGNELSNRLVGGSGSDLLEGLAGDDRLETSEQAGTAVEPDTARCGTGVDRGVVDLMDRPAGFPDCESVEQAAIDQHPTVRIARRASLLSARRLLAVRLRCPRELRRGCRGRLSIALAPKDTHGRGNRLASRRYRRIARGRAQVVRLRLSPREQRLVMRGRELRAIALERDRLGRPKRAVRTLFVRV